MNNPEIDARFVARAGVKLDGTLFPLLSRLGATEPMGAVELAALVGRDHSTVSRQVAKLEELGLVERRKSATDGRVRLLQPTSAGKRMLAEFARTRRKMMEDYFEDWSAQDRNELLRLMRKLTSTVDKK